jgi:hypothetical protein
MSLIFAPGSPIFLRAFKGKKYAGVCPLSSIRLAKDALRIHPEIDSQPLAPLFPHDLPGMYFI